MSTPKKFMFVNRKAPYGTIYALESLEVVLISAAFEQDVSLVFVDDGVYQLKKGQQTKGIETKNFSPTYRALEGYDVEKLYVERESLAARGLAEADLIVDVTVLGAAELGALMDEQDVVVSSDRTGIRCCTSSTNRLASGTRWTPSCASCSPAACSSPRTACTPRRAAARRKRSSRPPWRGSRCTRCCRTSRRAPSPTASSPASPRSITAASSISSPRTGTANPGSDHPDTLQSQQETLMPIIEVNGKSYETDEEGYLVNLGEWNEDVANFIAKTENVEMSTNHWEVVNFLRNYYEEYQIAPAVRVLTKAIGKQLGPEKGNSQYLYELFPYGPAKQACKIAGLPKPTGCV
jgi:sulfur relay protein TusC/DsrF